MTGTDARLCAQKLTQGEKLTKTEFLTLLTQTDEETKERLRQAAVEKRREIYGNEVFVRGLIEISSFCKNDCFYCGLRRSNLNAERYRLTPAEILGCADEGYSLGFRTFVLQGGEDNAFTDAILVSLISEIKRRYPDCAVTLSLGERGEESFRALFRAGADRYLMRHETASPAHYARLHPPALSFKNRMDSLYTLRKIGYAVGAGFMVGSPFQTKDDLAQDLLFIQDFVPDMCGIGPFIPHRDTPFADHPAGTLEETCFLLSLIRLIEPEILLPATTALGTIHPSGREKGILAGANVVMPNLSPVSVRKKYSLYDNKICTGDESAQCRDCLDQRMHAIGYTLVTDRGDKRTKGAKQHGDL